MRLLIEHLGSEELEGEISIVSNQSESPLIEALAEAVRIVGDTVPDQDKVDLVLTGDFVASVRARLSEPAGAERFHTSRGSNVTVAKTIPIGDRTVIVTPAAWFGDLRPEVAVSRRRMLSHEALHVALRQRGEQSHDARQRLAQSAAHGDYIASAGIVGEEYRVEAALRTEPPIETNYPHILKDALASARESFIDGITMRYSDEPITRTYETVMAAAHNLAITLAYFAAAFATDAGRAPIELPPEILQTPYWSRLVGQSWVGIAEALTLLPDARQSSTRQEIDRHVLGLASALEQWLRQVGFEILPIPGDEKYFNVLRHDF